MLATAWSLLRQTVSEWSEDGAPRLRAALDWLSERTRVTSSGWALGIEARVRALLRQGDVADRLYRESIGPARTFFAGRLANYVYIDMDDCMRQALDAAEGEVLPALRRSAPAG